MPFKITKKCRKKNLLPAFLDFSWTCTLFDWACLHVQGAAAYPENEDQQQRLREAAEGLRVATNAAAQNAIKKKLINRLEVSSAAGVDRLVCEESERGCPFDSDFEP